MAFRGKGGSDRAPASVTPDWSLRSRFFGLFGLGLLALLGAQKTGTCGVKSSLIFHAEAQEEQSPSPLCISSTRVELRFSLTSWKSSLCTLRSWPRSSFRLGASLNFTVFTKEGMWRVSAALRAAWTSANESPTTMRFRMPPLRLPCRCDRSSLKASCFQAKGLPGCFLSYPARAETVVMERRTGSIPGIKRVELSFTQDSFPFVTTSVSPNQEAYWRSFPETCSSSSSLREPHAVALIAELQSSVSSQSKITTVFLDLSFLSTRGGVELLPVVGDCGKRGPCRPFGVMAQPASPV
mmetsp:Transcript_5809/g.11638  ORF Transcript_5809/g.11638 Transcript_5809/m.11638 type:complete len:296 (+) Transcript_5809:231-1118(+)